MKKDLARFVDKAGLDRELIEVKLSSPMTWALVSVKEWDRCTTNADCRLADKQVKWRQMPPKFFFWMGSGIPRTNGICVMACLYATSITSSSLVVSDNCRVKTCSPSYVSQCNLWLSGFAEHIIIKTRKNPEDLTEVRVLTAFQRIANKNCLHDLLIFWRSKPVWLLFWHCRLHIESESVRGVRWEKKYGGKLSWLQLLPFTNLRN